MNIIKNLKKKLNYNLQNEREQIAVRNKVLEDCANAMELGISSIKKKNILYDDGTAQLSYSAAINMIDAYVENKDEKIQELLEKLHKANCASVLASKKENPWALDAYHRKEVSNGKSKEEVSEQIEEVLEGKFSIEYGNPQLFGSVIEKRDVMKELSDAAKMIRSYKI